MALISGVADGTTEQIQEIIIGLQQINIQILIIMGNMILEKHLQIKMMMVNGIKIIHQQSQMVLEDDIYLEPIIQEEIYLQEL